MVARNTGTLSNRTRVLKNQADEGNIIDDDQVAVKDTKVRNVGDVQSSRWFLMNRVCMVVPLKIFLDYHPKNFRESNLLKSTVISLRESRRRTFSG